MSGRAVRRPPRLRAGARVALVAPASPVAEQRIDVALERCERMSLIPVLGRAVRQRHAGFLAGTDEERLADLQWALTAPDVDAVWALRGGYGTMRLLRQLDLGHLRAAPRAFIGFSDNTAIHLALHAHDTVSYHAPHAGSDATPLAERCLQRVLWHAAPAGMLELPDDSRVPVPLTGGIAEGALIGGNLAMLAAMAGTAFPLRARECVLFVEDIGEASYRLDRSWQQLLLSGALDGVAGLAFGRFTECGGSDLLDLLRDFAVAAGVPAVAELPIGHEPDNWTLPLGVRARLDAGRGTLELLEAAVS